MTLYLLLEEFENAGGRFVQPLDGETKFKVALPPQMLEVLRPVVNQLREQRDGVLELLRLRYATPSALCGDDDCAGCYSVGEDVCIHPRRPAFKLSGLARPLRSHFA